jgi:hypothetical protein
MHILFFDYWDKGLRVYKDALNYFQDEHSNNKKTMVHLDSYFRQKNSLYEIIDDIDIFDISFFKTNNISQLIDLLEPDIILITNIKLYERIICLNANKKNIPVYYFLHGNIGPIYNNTKSNRSIKIFLNNIKNKIHSIKLITKYFKIYHKLYYPSYVIFNNQGNYFTRIFKFIFFSINKFKNRFYDFDYIEFPNDFYIDNALIYSREDAIFLNKTGVNIKNYIVQGNQELINNIKLFKNKWIEKSQIAIIDDGFTAYNLYNINPQKLVKALNDIVDLFSKHEQYNKFEIVFKIKPQEITKFELLDLKCRVIRDENVYQTIQESKLIIGTHSTALKFAILEYKPIIILNWPLFSEVPDVYLKNEIGNSWKEIKSLPTIFVNKQSYQKYILEYNLEGNQKINFTSKELN